MAAKPQRKPTKMPFGKHYPLLIGLAVVAFAAPASSLVNEKNGNFVIGYTDMTYKGVDLLVRSYNSVSSGRGMFGVGWGTPYETHVTVARDGKLRLNYNGIGRAVVFAAATSEPGPTQVFVANNGSRAVFDGKTYVVRSTYGRAHVMRFDRFGRMLSRADDRTGKLTYSLEYKNGVLDRVVHGNGTILAFRFNSAGRVARLSVVGVKGDAVYAYNDRGELVRSRDAGKNVYRYQYDQLSNMTAIHYADKTARRLRYQSKDSRISSDRRRNGCTTHYRYGQRSDRHYWTVTWRRCPERSPRPATAKEWIEQNGASGIVRTYRHWRPASGRFLEIRFSRRGRVISREQRSGAVPDYIAKTLPRR